MIFNMIIGGNMDMEKLEFIISMAKDVKNNRIMNIPDQFK